MTLNDFTIISHDRKKKHFTIPADGTGNVLGPKDWEQQMLQLTSEHKDVKVTRYNSFLDKHNQIAYRKLNYIRNHISDISTDIIALIPAARWLFDNFQMMYREIKKARTSGTSHEMLPILKFKKYRGYPRIYVVAMHMVALSGGHLDEETISIMLNAYQKEISLTDKELWVLSEMLGFCILENIIDIAEDIIDIMLVKSKADKFVKNVLGSNHSEIDISAFFKELEEELKHNYVFHSHVIYRLKNNSFDDFSIQKYLEYYYRFHGKKIKISNIYEEEGRIESYLETKIRALIISLRIINELDEEKLFQKFSCLEHILSQDPDGIYDKMDSESRGMYRGVIVKLSRKVNLQEEKIAGDCLELAQEGRDDLNCPHHVGTYLLGKGYPVLRQKVLGKPIPATIKHRKNIKGICYFLVLSLILLGICSFVAFIMSRQGITYRIYQYGLVLLLAIPLLTGISLEITNFIFTRKIQVKKLPSLDYLAEIPEQARTFVVMPVIVSTAEQGLDYFNRLENHYLANRQPNLYFALLIDFCDSKENQHLPEDELIENALKGRMNELNERYPYEHQRFSLLIRHRKWNESEKCYMGWERKRGKLEEFNRILNGERKEDTSYSVLLCEQELLGTFKYVITLDADTTLIRDNASKLVGLIDHPMNQAVLDPEGKKVLEGYVIIQPSVRNHIVDKKGSRFADIFGGESGLTHYATAISDIYQDIFDAGIYIGKGIYNHNAFHRLLHNTIPENRVLSHDLIESCYARTAFSSSARVMDNFPNSVLSFAKREHRWLRGDWQLLPWLFRMKDKSGRPVCKLSKWKIFDNLRRSMVPLSKTIFIVFNLAMMPRASFLWVLFLFFNDIFQLIIFLNAIIIQKIFRPKLALVYKGILRELGVILQRAFVELVITPYRAYVATDAMIRTLYRLYISKKNLLRWNTAESVDSSIVNTKKGYFLTMWMSYIPAVILLGLLMIREISVAGVILYTLLIVVWGLAFYISYLISQPKDKNQKKELEEDKELLLETARRTWQFFKEYSTKETNWLCPDNIQLSYAQKVSDKTSPTNIGLQFLSILSARDFGFETLTATLTSIENLMETVLKLVKWNGHLYNWYHTTTLEVLNPAYISTVDSGNFLGHLVALKNGLLDQMERPIYPDCLLNELRQILVRSKYNGELNENYKTIGDLIENLTDIWDELNGRKTHPEEDSRWIKELLNRIEMIVNEVAAFKLKEVSISSYPTLKELADKDNKYANTIVEKIKTLCSKIDCIIANADFRPLYNEKRMLFHIGYHVSSHVIDAGCYDLMASESALTSFLAVAKGDVPLRHWHKLGRPLTMVAGIPCFVSWSGTMFEYLMPNLVLKEFDGSVFAETSKAAILQQMEYADETKIPWGISESQYYRFDLNANYQYKAFGVPKLRLQPVRRNSLVVTPYATMLALDYFGENCLANLRRLIDLGVFGTYGFYEAIDFNGPDAIEMTPYCIVKSFMAHHQGMNLIAINNHLNQGLMRKRFHAEAMVKSTEALLEEKRQSQLISLAKRGYTIKTGKMYFKENAFSNRYVNSPAPILPVAGYLSNGTYSMMINSDGDGFSSYNNTMIHRWRADLYADAGNYIYIKDMKKGKVWSTAFHPTKTEPDEYQVIFSPHQVEFRRRDGDISTHTAISLEATYNMELRRVEITNHGKEERNFEITSFLEIVGDSHLAELSHPAFNKLFMESEFLKEQSVFLAKRRSNKEDNNLFLMHMLKSKAKSLRAIEYENDRLKFIGRNNTPENPDVVMNSIALSNNSGFCNDPIMSLRAVLSIGAGETVNVTFITGVCSSKEQAVKIGEEFNSTYRIEDSYEKFKLQTEIELKYLEITGNQLNAFQDLISPIYYPAMYYRGAVENIRRNFKNQSFLWRFGVSGDNPILLLRVKSIEDESVIRDVLKAYEYLRINRVVLDLIILSEAKHGYMQELDDLINDLTSSLRIYDSSNERRSLFLLHSYQMIPSEIDLLLTVARVVFTDKTGIYFRNVKEYLDELVEE